MSAILRSFLPAFAAMPRLSVYIANEGVANSEDSNSIDTISDGNTTDEITRVDIVGDESNVSKYPDILFSDFIASLLKVHRFRWNSLCGFSIYLAIRLP